MIKQIHNRFKNNNNIKIYADDTLGYLATTNNSFWKFCQSEKGRSCEEHFIKYEKGKIISAEGNKGLSFVTGTNIAECYMYGDCIAKFVFDNENDEFKKIANLKYKCYGSTFAEYEAQSLLVEKIYSLKDYETIRMLFSLCSDHRAVRNLLLDIYLIYVSFEQQLHDLGFKEMAELIHKVKTHYVVTDKDINVIKNEIISMMDKEMKL
jgi:hypothetical protein